MNGDLKNASDVTESLSEWIKESFNVLTRTRSAFTSSKITDESAQLAEAIRNAASGFAHYDTQFEITGAESLGSLRVVGQQDMIEALFGELFQNAVEAGAGRVLVSLDKDPESILVNCHVEDNGAGIPESIRERIFEDFFSSHRGKGSGMGIGLGFVRRLIEACGGSISLTPIQETGAHFVLKFVLFTGH